MSSDFEVCAGESCTKSMKNMGEIAAITVFDKLDEASPIAERQIIYKHRMYLRILYK